MPFQLARDDTSRRLRLTVIDPITAAELITSAERQFAEGAWPYGMIVDARSMSLSPSQAEIRLFVARVRELVTAHGPRGPIAFVAREPTAIGTVQIYMFLGGKTDFLEVFWDMAEAQAWLDEQMPQMH